jgi:outer membrane protein assembly factor BamB
MRITIALSATLLCCLAPIGSDAADSGKELLEASGVRGGLVVVVGCADLGLLTDIGRREGYLVHGLDTDRAQVTQAREHVQQEKVARRASVSTWNGVNLPFVDNTVNLLVLANAHPIPKDTELKRILAPGGGIVAWKRPDSDLAFTQVGDWFVVRKAIPESLDEWSHHMHDSTGIGAGNDRAVGPPRHLQWKAGPEFSRSHENMSSVSAVVSSGGRVFSIMDEGPLASIYLPSQWSLTARDAFSGVQLWKKPIESWHARLFPLKSGPAQLMRRIVAAGDHVYVTLGLDAPVSKLNAATGEVLLTYAEPLHVEELLWIDGKLVVVSSRDANTEPFQGRMPANRPDFSLEERVLGSQSNKAITVIDTSNDEVAWSLDGDHVVPLTAVADRKRLCFLVGTTVRCIDLGTGEATWDRKLPGKNVKATTYHSPTVLLHEEIVYVALDRTLRAIDATNGKELWNAACAAAGYRSPASIFVLNGLIWDIDASGEPYRPKSKVVPGRANRTFVGYDLRTGEVRKKLPILGEHGYGVMHHRCHIPRASGDYILTAFPGIEFIDTNNGDIQHHSWIRGACVYGFMPANGLIYAPPHPCACYMEAKLTGFLAVAPARKDLRSAPVSEASKLIKGPAFGVADESDTSSSEEWATYRGDVARSGRYPGQLPTSLKKAWSQKVGGRLTQPIVADGRLYTVAKDAQKLCALDAETGDMQWSHGLASRVDSSPTCHKGMILFGGRGGYVYALRASNGELIWKFRAAPEDLRLVAYDGVESVWPVHGSVLVQDEVVWFVAGRSSFLDGGLFVFRLDSKTGRELSMTRIHLLAPDGTQPPILADAIQPTDIGGREATRLDMAGAKPDVLSCDGTHVFMRHHTFDLDGKSVDQNIDHLFSPTGFLDDSWFRRTYWVFGNHFVGGAQGWARAGNTMPSGRIMSIGRERIFGFGRDRYPPSPGNPHQMYAAGETEILFAMKRHAMSGKQDKWSRRSKPRQSNESDQGPYEWSMPADLQVRAMLVANNDETLFVAGAKGDWVTSPEAYQGHLGSTVRAVSARDGRTIAEYELPASPIFDGMAAAYGRIYVALQNGSLLCLTGK